MGAYSDIGKPELTMTATGQGIMRKEEGMGKTAFPEANRQDTFKDYPEKLTIITDPAHELFDERALEPFKEELVADILARGQLQPIVVRKNGKNENGEDVIEVIYGRRRVKAILEINRRLEASGQPRMKVWWVNTTDSDEKEVLGKIIAENEIRFADPPSIKARKLHRYIQRGATEKEAATAFGISIAECKKLLKLMELHKDAAIAIDEGRLSLSAASKLIGLNRAEQKKLLESLTEDGGKITAERIEEQKNAPLCADGGIPAPRVKLPRQKTRKEIERKIVEITECADMGEMERNAFVDALRWVVQ